MQKKVLADINAHALQQYPREACGLVLAMGRRQVYLPCNNSASGDGAEQFRISAEQYAAAEDQGKVLAVVHSHPNHTAVASEADRVTCEGSGLPWHIVSVMPGPDDQPVVADLQTIKPVGYKAPLIGREFHHGVLDCYALIRDWYAQEKGITLPDFPRTDGWWERGEDLYMRQFGEAGFTVVPGGIDAVQPGDVILMQYRSPDNANHGGIYLGDVPGIGRSIMLHHLYGRLSERVVYGGYWAEITRAVLRHRELM
ncbi:C40 family peptidase [Silvimonas soli]|uniref:C40 family peptidase n=1 Tax=Silvimonas soli TaxID=2980100 RepID=UPI0024B3914A|nr:C40 family peptidase [Silvimonas soli]